MAIPRIPVRRNFNEKYQRVSTGNLVERNSHDHTAHSVARKECPFTRQRLEQEWDASRDPYANLIAGEVIGAHYLPFRDTDGRVISTPEEFLDPPAVA